MEGQQCSENVATHITLDQKSVPSPEGKSGSAIDSEMPVDLAENPADLLANTVNKRINESSTDKDDLCKKIKTEHDYDMASNGLDVKESSTSNQTLSRENKFDTQIDLNDNKVLTKSFIEKQLESKNHKLKEILLEDIMEHYFLCNDWKLNEYYSWKKRVQHQLLSLIVNDIIHWCENFKLSSRAHLLIKFLDPNLSNERISDLCHSSSHTSLAPSLTTNSQSSSTANSAIVLNHFLKEPSRLADIKVSSPNSTAPSRVNSSSLATPLTNLLVSEKVLDRKLSITLEESNVGTNEQIVEAAKQEAYVMKRIADLRKNGVWSIKRLPKVQEPPRNKVHWDYLLEEMQWLAVDFLQERKWKKNAAKKCSKMIIKYHSTKEFQAERIEKEEQIKMKRIASNIAKLVKQFWSEIEKVIETKQEVQLNEKRKKIQDMQLRFIVDKADHFTEKLAQELVVPSVKNSTAPSVASDLETIDSCNDFEPNTDDETDDEVTITKEDDERDLNEIELLKRESEIPLEQLANSLPDEFIARITSQKRPSDDMDDDVEFEVGSTLSEDNEETIDIEEANHSIDHTKEINDLENEANIPIDQLLSNYGYNKAETDDEITTNTDETENNDEMSDDSADNVNSENEIGLKFLIGDMEQLEGNNLNGPNRDLSDIAAGAESIQPKGNTLSSVEVQTKVPFLLKFQLREYQHIGLDWLVAMYERNLNGILADEMGLGKTIQTIALIAHLACEKGIWGQHLIVVPTSVMLNWEMEFKKWCPSFKILTYYGSPKERRLKRKGWTKPNTFHVCITSYKLVVQDHQSFRRKKWVYLILDEAQHIKNFKSQRWQMLLNFNSTRRLLLTGTPLQNNLLELWSLMHFLMPNVFSSHREFKDWFVNPVTGMIEGNNDYNEELIKRLHKVLRPFLLRRLKCDVEKQLPKKYEHIIHCQLSKRQRFLYDEFMSQGATKETLSTGSFLSVINILMQLRKVCNHPNLFDPRPTISPFIDDGITYNIPSTVTNILDYQPFSEIDLKSLNLVFSHLSVKSYIQEKTISSYCDASIIGRYWNVGNKVVYARLKDLQGFRRNLINPVKFIALSPNYISNSLPALDQTRPKASLVTSTNPNIKIVNKLDLRTAFPENSNSTILRSLSQINKSAISSKVEPKPDPTQINEDIALENCENTSDGTIRGGDYAKEDVVDKIEQLSAEKLNRLALVNKRRCYNFTIYPSNMIESFNFNQCKHLTLCCENETNFHGGYCASSFQKGNGDSLCYLVQSSNSYLSNFCHSTNCLSELISTPERIATSLKDIFSRFLCIVPNVIALPPKFSISHAVSYKKIDEEVYSDDLTQQLPLNFFDIIRFPRIQRSFQLPELRLIQYDCGKLQILDKLLHQLKSGGHRVLIFTQMSRMLDIFEQFLNYHGHIYLRLDGSTKIEQRHMLMERFNNDPRFFCFILSTRSGGVGVNLTGADTVIFYDSDWNPTMDAQAQDRCHRIGQTKDVHIYRIISERTIEENILKKAQQKKLLGDLAIEGGNFTTAFFKETAIKELFDVDQNEKLNSTTIIRELSETPAYEPNADNLNLEHALFTAEDETDVAAVKVVRAEVDAEFAEFDENIPIEENSEDKSPEEEQIEQLISQLSPVERYALKFAESSRDFQELKQAEEEIEETKKQWQKSMDEWKMTTLTDDEHRRQIIDEYRDSIMTCSRQDSAKVFISLDGHEPMPVWSPPTPPQDENDLYIDYSLGFLYEKTLMPESQLPLIYLPKEHKRLRVDSAIHGRKRSAMPSANSTVSSSSGHLPPSHIGSQTTKSSRRLDDLFTISKSPFDRSTSIISRFRRELLMMKLKLWPGSISFISPIQKTLTHLGSSVVPPSNITSQQSLAKANHNFNSNIFPKWLVHEEFAIIKVLMYFQDLPFNLSIICPGHIPNWDFVAEQVNSFSCIKRSAKFCKFHFESVMAAKDDLRMNAIDQDNKTLGQTSNTKQGKSTKKNKNQQTQSVLSQQSFISLANYSPSASQMNSVCPQNSLSSVLSASASKGPINSNQLSSTTQPLIRISNILQNMVNDNNMEFTRQMNSRFDAIKSIVIKKTQTSKSRFKKMPPKVFDHVSLLQNEYGIHYDKPLSVEKVAMNRAERILKEKQAREQAARALPVRDMSEYQQQSFTKPPLQQQQPHLKQLFQATTSTPIANQAQFHSPSTQSVSNVAASIQQQQQQQQQTPQILLSQVPVTANSNTFIAAQQLQHVLTSKAASKLQNLSGSNDNAPSMASDQASVALGSKMINSHVVSIQSSSPNVHHVTLSQAQSLGLISSLQQSPDGSPNTASALQQHLQQQTSSTGQFVQSNQAGQQQIPVNVSITNQSQIQHKLFAAIAASGGNVNVTHSNSNISQNAQVNQIIASNQTLSRLTPQYKQLIFRQNPQQFRQQLTQPQTQLQVSSSFQVIPQSRHIHMQPIRAQNMVQTGSATSTPTQRYQITSISGQGSHSVLSQSLISGGIKQIVTTASAINVSNSQPHCQVVGSTQRILASTAASGHAIPSSLTGSLIASNKATVVASGNNSIIARTIRPDNLLASQILKQHSQMGASNSSSLSSNSNMVSAPTSQIYLQQHSQHIGHSSSDNSTQQPTSIPVSFVKNSGSSGTGISAIQISASNSSNVSVPMSSSLVSNAKLIAQSLGNVTVVPSSLATSCSSVPFMPGTQLRQVHLLQKRTQPTIQVSSTPSSGQQLLTHKAIVQQSGTSHSVVVSSDGHHSNPSSSQSIVSPLLQSSNSLNKTSNMFHLVPASAVQQFQQQQQSIPITVTTKAVLSATPSVSVHQVHQAFKQGSIMMQAPNQQGTSLAAHVSGQTTNVSTKPVKIKFAPSVAHSIGGGGAIGIRLQDKIIVNAVPASSCSGASTITSTINSEGNNTSQTNDNNN